MPEVKINLPEHVVDQLAWICDRRGEDLQTAVTSMVDEYLTRERIAARDCPMGGLAREFWPELFSEQSS